ncbi:DUF2787 family protein [Gayadomonas joobiniege]|uniref:DUF2787 family protein n=1 Tax=Gayadomonas joobiniege TaxID=1234606 RepID=UPI000367C848|nr:DUF2787 family protein [Gayadomonas joobiniege]
MNLNIDQESRLPLPTTIYRILGDETKRLSTDISTAQAITFNFRDPTYTAENGGFHPVEIRLEQIDGRWKMIYITDFQFVGFPFPELIKAIDVCFGTGRLFQFGLQVLAKFQMREVFELFIRNFITYYELGAYEVDISIER